MEDLKWKKINSFKGEYYNVTEDRPYTREEIKILVDRTDLRNKAIILLMSSSGLRIGAIPDLKVGDLAPIDKYNLYQITVYKKSKSKYITFCTPETRTQIDNYIKWRESVGEKIKPESSLFRKTFDRDDLLQARNPKPLKLGTFNWVINSLLYSTDVRTPTTTATTATTTDTKIDYIAATTVDDDNNNNNVYKKREVMQGHGFRKFFDTTCTIVGMNPVYIEFCMGHSLGLKGRYAKPSPTDLLEGNDKSLGYISAINDLTINEENRLKRENEMLKVEKSQLDTLALEISKIEISKMAIILRSLSTFFWAALLLTCDHVTGQIPYNR
jgi:integrase